MNFKFTKQWIHVITQTLMNYLHRYSIIKKAVFQTTKCAYIILFHDIHHINNYMNKHSYNITAVPTYIVVRSKKYKQICTESKLSS